MGMWAEKKNAEGVVFGDGAGKVVLLERFECVWPRVEEVFP